MNGLKKMALYTLSTLTLIGCGGSSGSDSSKKVFGDNSTSTSEKVSSEKVSSEKVSSEKVSSEKVKTPTDESYKSSSNNYYINNYYTDDNKNDTASQDSGFKFTNDYLSGRSFYNLAKGSEWNMSLFKFTNDNAFLENLNPYSGYYEGEDSYTYKIDKKGQLLFYTSQGKLIANMKPIEKTNDYISIITNNEKDINQYFYFDEKKAKAKLKELNPKNTLVSPSQDTSLGQFDELTVGSPTESPSQDSSLSQTPELTIQ